MHAIPRPLCRLVPGARPGECALVVSLVVLAIFDQPADAALASNFPRGPGMYFNITKLIGFLILFLSWVGICNWADEDAKEVDLDPQRWNLVTIFSGMLGFAVVWMLPLFWLSFVLFWAIHGGAALWYVYTRNQRVDTEDRLFTAEHFQALYNRYIKKVGPAKKGIKQDVIFLTGDSQGRADNSRFARVQENKGFRAAQDMLLEAVESRCTDIHMEPTRDEMTVRFRVDGIMVQKDPFSRNMGDGVLNIFKVIANLDIAEKRKPQDGSFSAEIKGSEVDVRVATAGSVAGEKMVMRILNKTQQMLDLGKLGMRDKLHEQIRAIVTQPHGLFLVCGPTGAGKSSTLYACLNEIDRFQQNIITVENPVEYHLDGVTQIQVNPKAGKTFASELRSILRQDPDVILIGEIRDQETAEIACQAAQTGHMVFSTIHSNDAVLAIGRLIDLGVQPFMVGTALTGILAQRLVRLLCPDCKVKYKPNPELLKKANLPADKIKFFYRPPKEDEVGEEPCPTCMGTGYYKRTGIFELLVISEGVREQIKDKPNLNAIRQQAIKEGMRLLYEDGLRQVIEGKTSIQELLRVSK